MAFIKVTIIRYEEKENPILDKVNIRVPIEYPEFLNLDLVEGFRLDDGKMYIVYKTPENGEGQIDDLKNSAPDIEEKLVAVGMLAKAKI